MIIKSILDTDLYKFTTSYAYMKLFPQAVGTFEFKDRDNTEYTEEFVEQLRIELYNLAQVRLTSDEFEFMNSIRFIPRHYWEWLSQFTFNPSKVQIFLDEEKHLHIIAKDYLYEVSLYEVPILAALFDACADAGDVNMANSYYLDELEEMPSRTPIANGNLQARCRMMYLYDIASRHKGLVMSTDNQTEYQLGFWTIHGDVGDFDPIQDLWKTEVYRLARWICDYYTMMSDGEDVDKIQAIRESVALTPTDGLGISNSDLEQIGARTYYDVDRVLQTLICKASPENDKLQDSLEQELGREVVHKIIKRHTASEFKRKKAPIYITREKYEND